MHIRHVSSSRTVRRALASAGIVGLALGAAACGSDDSGSGSSGSGGSDKIGVSLITKDSTNPFFVAMQKGAKEDATKQNVALTVASGKQEGDDQGQITAIEDAIARGDKGILITPMSTGVNAAIKKARDAGLYVIALDTPPDPANTVDITFATDNLQAGKLIGQWTKSQLGGKSAVIAMLDLFNDKIVSVDLNRDHGFLQGMGIDPGSTTQNGQEAKTGNYSGGTYTIACHQPTQGAIDGGRTAMENCLSGNPDINVVYAINEPAAQGAYNALKAAGKADKVQVYAIDGSCSGLKFVTSGEFTADAVQYPGKMAGLGVDSIAKLARGGAKPSVTDGKDFFDTGTALVATKPAGSLTIQSPTDAASACWGS